MPQNPRWERDELVLALELYFQVNPAHTSPEDPRVIALSQELRQLGRHLHPANPDLYRNPNGVYMKLCNFLRCDPAYPGVGLDAGSKKDIEVWDELAGNRARLRAEANRIRSQLGDSPDS